MGHHQKSQSYNNTPLRCGYGAVIPTPACGHKRGGGKPDEIVPGTMSPSQIDWLQMIKVENLKKESVSFGFHGASGTLGQNICFLPLGSRA